MGTLWRPGWVWADPQGVSWAYIDTVGGICWTRPKACPGVAEWGVPGGWAPRTQEKFSEIFINKPIENYHFRPIFQNFNENFVKMSRIFGENLGKISKYSFIRGSGAEAFEARDFIKKLSQSNGNLVFFENFHKLSKKTWFVEANLNKNYSNFDGILQIFSKSIINSVT